jgi:hypothetical protein
MRVTASQKFNAAINLIAGQGYTISAALEIIESLAERIPGDSIETPSKEDLEKIFHDVYKKYGISQATVTILTNLLQIELGFTRNQAVFYIQSACEMNILDRVQTAKGHICKLTKSSSKDATPTP